MRVPGDVRLERRRMVEHAIACGSDVLELRSTDKACCDDIYRVSVQKKLQLEHKIKALTTMSQALTRLIDMCSHDRKSLDECPILGALDSGVASQRGKTPKAQVRKGGKSR